MLFGSLDWADYCLLFPLLMIKYLQQWLSRGHSVSGESEGDNVQLMTQGIDGWPPGFLHQMQGEHGWVMSDKQDESTFCFALLFAAIPL